MKTKLTIVIVLLMSLMVPVKAQNKPLEQKEVAHIFTKTDNKVILRILDHKGCDLDYNKMIESGQLKAYAVNMAKNLKLSTSESGENNQFTLHADIPFKNRMEFIEVADKIIGTGYGTTIIEINGTQVPLIINYIYKAFKALYGSAMYIETIEFGGKTLGFRDKRLTPIPTVILRQNSSGEYVMVDELLEL